MVAVLFAVFISIGMKSYCLPRPIGQLSDYGNVLDRHGRERIISLIDQARERFGIDVYILASWEDPYGDPDRYAVALLDAWNLAQGKTLLAVFLRAGRDWDVAILLGELIAADHPQLARIVETGITDLVAHRRIEEAMVALFEGIEQQLLTTSLGEQPAVNGRGSRALPVLALIGSVGLVAVFIHRRICPRCGRILRIRKRRSFAPYQKRRDVIYYCQRCNYSRAKKGEG